MGGWDQRLRVGGGLLLAGVAAACGGNATRRAANDDSSNDRDGVDNASISVTVEVHSPSESTPAASYTGEAEATRGTLTDFEAGDGACLVLDSEAPGTLTLALDETEAEPGLVVEQIGFGTVAFLGFVSSALVEHGGGTLECPVANGTTVIDLVEMTSSCFVPEAGNQIQDCPCQGNGGALDVSTISALHWTIESGYEALDGEAVQACVYGPIWMALGS